MFDFKVTAELIAAVVGAVISLLFTYFPGLNTWFAAKPENAKKLWMLLMMVIVAAAIFGGGCIDIFHINLDCTVNGLWELVGILIAGIVANQGVFKIFPTPIKVKNARVD